MIASSGAQTRTMMDTFRGAARRVVVLSSMDVYRSFAVLHELEPGPIEPLPLTEDSPLRTSAKTYPAEEIRTFQQLFGWLDDAYDKVAVERTVRSDPDLAATVLRLAMVYGPGDPLHRCFPVLKRMLDGRLLIPFEERVARWQSPRGTWRTWARRSSWPKRRTGPQSVCTTWAKRRPSRSWNGPN